MPDNKDTEKIEIEVVTPGAEVNARQLRQFLVRILEHNEHLEEINISPVAVFITGHTGIGKTAIVKDLTEEGVKVVELPLAEIEEMGDIHGLPIHVKDNTGNIFTRMAPPWWVPRDEGPGVLLLDDMTRADRRIVQGTMQLIQFHHTVSWALPKKWTIVGTGNPEASGYFVTSFDPAQLTRFAHVTLKADIKSWTVWAEGVGLDNRLISFLIQYPEQLCAGERANPRTYEQFARTLSMFPDSRELEMLGVFASAFLPNEVVAVLMTFLSKDFHKIVDPYLVLQTYSPEVSKLLEEHVTVGRLDLLSITLERITAILVAKGIRLTQTVTGNLTRFFAEDFFPTDLRYATLQRLAREQHLENLITRMCESEKIREEIESIVS